MINTIISYVNSCNVVSSDIMNFVGIYMFWSATHIISSKLYSTYCANWSWKGLFTGGLYAMTPHCKSLLWIQTTTTNHFNSWWLTTSSWFLLKIKNFNNYKKL